VGREDAPLFAALAVPPRARLLAAAFEDPGASQTELCAALDLPRQSIAKAAAALDDLGLLRIVRDGRRRRYYPTNLLAQRREANRPRARTFAEHLVRRLAEEGLAPRVLRRTPSRLLLRLTYRGQSVSLDLPTDPFATVLL
jgi:DNA-binding transcriptional ArsR family regulator